MSARLITGRPLIAGIGNYPLAESNAPTAQRATADLAPPSGRPGNRSPPEAASLGDCSPSSSTIPASRAAFYASSCWRSEALRGQAADGTFAEALLAVPPFGAGPAAAAQSHRGRADLRSTSGRGRPRQSPARSAASENRGA